MRKLIYVPIIHTDADLGSLAQAIEERASVVVGASNRLQYKEVVRLYWQEIATYWEGRDVSGIKIFQDGMPADGKLAEKMVQSLAQDGSINYQILEQLMQRGAELMKTEDPELLKEEYLLTKDLLKKRSALGSLGALLRYRWHKDRLLRARDTYISKRINACLEEGATAACFLGAHHQLLPLLAKDIQVVRLKNLHKVKAYTQKYRHKKSEDEVNRLARYLITPIEMHSSQSGS